MRVAIIGLGLIGGSLGLALRKADVGMELVGFARRPEVATRALDVGAVTCTEASLTSVVENADVVFIATPAVVVRELLVEIGNHLGDGVIVSDTASTKATVMSWADEILPPSASSIGGHPMAGMEASGIDAADGELFNGCTYCLVPGRNATREAIDKLEELVRHIGATPLFIAAEEHDNLVAGISHLPLVISLALVAATTKSPSWSSMAALAATGYRDITRLASGDPRMGRDICLTNGEQIQHWIDTYIAEMQELRRQIAVVIWRRRLCV
jgi:prephenate dehydrogenase